ncbi:MAG: hypothetical protein BAJALOKI1v1_120033 [Promethearchaeota archaeon]|nr:MAG: hypothetical protein BAJALOKI1v1_120033 [Candidatus Lokiarchaeota archaeon]
MIRMNNNGLVEKDFYDEILKFFNRAPHKQSEVEIWKHQTYIELMKVLKKTQNKQKVRNSIILLLMLFGENIPPDIYNTRGNKRKNLNTDEKNKLISLLKDEFRTSSNS